MMDDQEFNKYFVNNYDEVFFVGPLDLSTRRPHTVEEPDQKSDESRSTDNALYGTCSPKQDIQLSRPWLADHPTPTQITQEIPSSNIEDQSLEQSLYDSENFNAHYTKLIANMSSINGGILKTNPRMRRDVKTSLKDDEKYRLQRNKNNEAAKKSRDKRKMREVKEVVKSRCLQETLKTLQTWSGQNSNEKPMQTIIHRVDPAESKTKFSRPWLANHHPPSHITHKTPPNEVSTLQDPSLEQRLYDSDRFKAYYRKMLADMSSVNGGILKSNPRMRRDVKTSVSDDDNEKYRLQRSKNNEAAKRSRDRRKMREVEQIIKNRYLEDMIKVYKHTQTLNNL